MTPGDICRHDRFYVDRDTGQFRAKFLLFLAPTRSGDWVARLLTSRANFRPRVPPCFHGDPYPGYYLGVPGPPLILETWLDLRGLEDLDSDDVRKLIGKGVMRPVFRLGRSVMRDVLECAARAADTTIEQERVIRNQLAKESS